MLFSKLVYWSSYLKVPVVYPPCLPGKHLKLPTIWTLSPGLQRSTKSLSHITSTLLGSWPVGAFSGISWIVSVWWSLYVERPNSVSNGLPSSSYIQKIRNIIQSIYFWIIRLIINNYCSWIHSRLWKCFKWSEVSVSAFHYCLCCIAIMNTSHNLWTYQRT